MRFKNFKAPIRAKEKLITKPILVSDYMSTKITIFKPEQTILSVIDTLVRKKISGGPVVNNNGELVGIISEGDCMKKISDSRYFNVSLGNATVAKYMVTDVETIDGNMNIFDATNKFLESKRRRFPIVEGNKLIGLISQKDILKAALLITADKHIKKFNLSDLF